MAEFSQTDKNGSTRIMKITRASQEAFRIQVLRKKAGYKTRPQYLTTFIIDGVDLMMVIKLAKDEDIIHGDEE